MEGRGGPAGRRGAAVRVLLWHVHGSWTTAFVQGDHTYLVPTLPGRGPDGRGRARTWQWPASVTEVAPESLPDLDVDVVVLQRPCELAQLAPRWLGREPGRDVPAVYLEHNAPDGWVNSMRHPVADRSDIPLVHVTWFNQMMWDSGRAPTAVIEHGIIDPGHRYTGELHSAAAVINDPCRRGRITGTDLVEQARHHVAVDLFGMRSEPLGGTDLDQAALHSALARRRVYFHPNRWTSLGLSLIEAMQLGLPVVALSATEAPAVIPADAGVVTNRPADLFSALQRLVHDRDEAAAMGRRARHAALERFGIDRFLVDWDRQLKEVTS